MTLALEMYAVAPAIGRASLSPQQEALLVGKARWIREAAEAGLPVIPTIAITRAAWEGLQQERRQGGDRLRTHWVATLFKLVARDGKPPLLVVRTSAETHSTGLMSARLGIAPPGREPDAVDPGRPLARAISDAFESYGSERAIWVGENRSSTREGQIVVVQAMSEGTLEQFLTRDPLTGAMGPAPATGKPSLDLPHDAVRVAELLDARAGRAMQCLVAVEGGSLRFVSARQAQISPAAELEAAVDRVARGTWSEAEAVAHSDPGRLQNLLHPRIDSPGDAEAIATGLGVSPGAASGVIVFTPDDAARMKARGRHCILVVNETGPADIQGLKAATGILTARGGMTSHAAVVARVIGRPCVAGVRSLAIDHAEFTCSIGGETFNAGDRITIDGTDGTVYRDALPLTQPQIGGAISRLLTWSDATRSIAVRANAETLESLATAQSFGAEGIGLARSEHMFFSEERLVALRRLILSEDEDDRKAALRGLVDYQTGDYSAIFSAMPGRPVTVRLFDPPLHEFLPRSDEDLDEIAKSLGLAPRALRQRLERIEEVNPMLGHRGVRLAITYPEILEMQIQALLAGLREASRDQDEPNALEVMVPFVSTVSEVHWVRERVMAAVEAAELPKRVRERFAFGTMLELPRACLRAGDIAASVDFFSFGTNDLTQTSYGISRDDAPAFLAAYQRKGIYELDPFVSLDERGVGELMALAIERGKRANPNLRIGICGEHAGDPTSLRFFAGLDVDYVSCSPYRVPVARLALAQAGADRHRP